MQITNIDPILPLFDGDLNALVEEFADTSDIKSVEDFIDNHPLDLTTMMGLIREISTLITNIEQSDAPNDQKAANSPIFKKMVSLLNTQVDGNPSLITAALSNDPQDFAEDIILDGSNNHQILYSIQTFLAFFPPNQN